MSEVKAPDGMICHLLRRDGLVVGAGDAVAYVLSDHDVQWYSTYGERETSPEVVAWRRWIVSIETESKANAMKSTTEYPGKRYDAERWRTLHPLGLLSGLIPPTGFEYLRAEADACGCTWDYATDKILAAVERDAQEMKARLILREKARAMRSS